MNASIKINFLVPFNDHHLVSQDYEITNEILETWTLGRLKIPVFNNTQAMKNWIVALDFLINSKKIVLMGPQYPFNRNWQLLDGYYNTYTKAITVEDKIGTLYQLPSRDFANKNSLPLELLDTKKLYDYLKKESDACLSIQEYGPFVSTRKENGQYFFEDVYMYGIAEFLMSNEKIKFSTAPQYLNDSTDENEYNKEESFNANDIFWKFKDEKNNESVFVIEFKFIESKKEDQLSYFNSWKMWHEKYIYNEIMYFVIFQTDDIHDENLDDYFKVLVKTITKRYRINAYAIKIKDYLNKKSGLHAGT